MNASMSEIMGDEAVTLTGTDALRFFIRMNAQFDMALARPQIDFDMMQDNERSAWVTVFEHACRMVGEWEGKKVAWISEQLCNVFQTAANSSQVLPWADILPEDKLKWEFLFRACLICLEWTSDEGSILKQEEELAAMFRERLDQLTQGTPT